MLNPKQRDLYGTINYYINCPTSGLQNYHKINTAAESQKYIATLHVDHVNQQL